MGRIKGEQSSLEGFMMANGKPGDIFYSDKSDRALTAIANYYNRKIVTERLIVLKPFWKDQTTSCITGIALK